MDVPEQLIRTPQQTYNQATKGAAVKPLERLEEPDMVAESKVRRALHEHGIDVNPEALKVRVVSEIPCLSFLGLNTVYGRCGPFFDESGQWQGAIILVSQEAYERGEQVLEGVLMHELAHALHGSVDPTHSESDPHFRELCRELGGFVEWSDMTEHFEE